MKARSLRTEGQNGRRPSKPQLLLRLRVLCGEDVALGPGKIDLLASIADTGSIREAAERMDMSYMRAWKLVKTMNACFKEPLVEAVRGGRGHGGAVLTANGREALRCYRQMESNCMKAARPHWHKLKSLLNS